MKGIETAAAKTTANENNSTFVADDEMEALGGTLNQAEDLGELSDQNEFDFMIKHNEFKVKKKQVKRQKTARPKREKLSLQPAHATTVGAASEMPVGMSSFDNSMD